MTQQALSYIPAAGIKAPQGVTVYRRLWGGIHLWALLHGCQSPIPHGCRALVFALFQGTTWMFFSMDTGYLHLFTNRFLSPSVKLAVKDEGLSGVDSLAHFSSLWLT